MNPQNKRKSIIVEDSYGDASEEGRAESQSGSATAGKNASAIAMTCSGFDASVTRLQ